MFRLSLFPVLIVSLFCLNLHAEELPLNQEAPPTRWESLTGTDHIFARPFVGYRSLGLQLSDLGDDRTVEWRPNVSASLGTDFYYRDFPAVGFSYSLPSFNPGTYGKTRSYDVRAEFDILNRYYFQLDWQHYKGFFTRDAGSFTPGPFKDSSLEINNVSVRNIFVFSPDKFSLEALRTQSKRQIKSGGSILSGIYAGWAQASSPNGLIPLPVQPLFGKDGSLARVTNISLLLRGGYGYNWVFYRNFFLGGYGLLGIGGTQTQLKYNSSTPTKNKANLAVDINLYAALGYTGDKFSSSLNFDLESIALPTSNSTMTQKLMGASLNVGWRF